MKRELIVQRTPKSPIAEVFRTLRTNIQFMNSKKQLKTILITSTMPGEGKSWTASNLAITFAQAGKKVALVDADMRKGRLHSLFSVDKTPGLSNYLSGIDDSGRMESSDVLKFIKPTEVENLYVMPAGNFPPNPSELLSSEATITLMDKLKSIFDIVIFDGTPSLFLTDSVILSRLADSTIIVTKCNSSKKEDLLKIKRDIENVGGNIAGVILNQIPMSSKKLNETYYYSSSATKEPRRLPPTTDSDFNEQHKENSKTEYVVENDGSVSKERTQEIIDELNKYLKK